MNDLRTYIQSKLNEIESIESGRPFPDNVIEDGVTYFGYELQEDFINSDCDSNYSMRISLIGRLVRKENSNENTLQIIDEALAQLKSKLKEMKFRYSYKDVSIETGIIKIQVTAEATYNEII